MVRAPPARHALSSMNFSVMIKKSKMNAMFLERNMIVQVENSMTLSELDARNIERF